MSEPKDNATEEAATEEAATQNAANANRDETAQNQSTASSSAPDASNARKRAARRNYSPEYERAARRPADERENAFNTLAWLVDGATGLMEELRHSDLGLSEEFWVHLYAARREGLLAARAAVDSLLEKTEQEHRQAKEKADRQSRRGSVDIEF